MPRTLTVCSRCGAAFPRDRRAFLPNPWRLCPRCRGTPPPTGTVAIESVACHGCGRPLRAGIRSLGGAVTPTPTPPNDRMPSSKEFPR
jgi:hypothetical protein